LRERSRAAGETVVEIDNDGDLASVVPFTARVVLVRAVETARLVADDLQAVERGHVRREPRAERPRRAEDAAADQRAELRMIALVLHARGAQVAADDVPFLRPDAPLAPAAAFGDGKDHPGLARREERTRENTLRDFGECSFADHGSPIAGNALDSTPARGRSSGR